MTAKRNNLEMERPAWASRVKDILREQGRTQAWLARKLEIDSTQLRHILNGNSRYRATDDFKAQVAELLDIPITDITVLGNGND